MTTDTLVQCRSQLIGNYGDLEQDALPDTKPVEADKRVSDVLGAPYPENEPCCRALYRLKTVNQVGR